MGIEKLGQSWNRTTWFSLNGPFTLSCVRSLWWCLGTLSTQQSLSWSWGLLSVPPFTCFSPCCLPLTHPSLEMNFTRGSFLNVCLTFFNLKHADKINLVRHSWCLAYSWSSANGFSMFEMFLAFLRVFSADWMDHVWANNLPTAHFKKL